MLSTLLPVTRECIISFPPRELLHISTPVLKLDHPSRTKKKSETSSKFIRDIPMIPTRFVKRKTGPMVCPPRSLTLSSVSGLITVQMYSNKNGSLEGEAWLISFVRTRTTRMRTLEGARWSKRENA